MSSTQLWRRPLISGIGQSQIGRRIERSSYQLTIDAVLAAVADAGLEVHEIDGLATSPGQAVELNPGFNGPDLYEVQDGLGLEVNWHLGASQGPAQFMSLIAAATAVSTGLCRHAIVFRTTTEASAQGKQRRRGLGETMTEAEGVLSWLLASGAVSAANWTSFYLRRHMHEFGTTKEQLGWVPITERKHAMDNPDAIKREQLTMDEYLASRSISTPLSLFDCDIPVDGSTAVVISAPETRDGLRHWVEIESVGTSMWHRPYWEHWPDLTTMAPHDAAAHMWSQTSLKPSDVDVAQIYDAFSPFVLFWLEAMGFCQTGESGPFVEGGTQITHGGKLPLNTWGGQLSGGRLHGWGFLAEAVRQLRHDAKDRQVADTEVAAVGVGGGAAASAMLLTTGR
ncbi:thiolase family protein [Haloechinothrix sp. YIM 98757]|uniref:Thiolase family protein n=1 Tax=Haloechinothrix aidingensis TaxID=2752311 RepID=A0A838ACA0_9PSEU|nr:thiolase family protein [Haloechinothrix aidingensis]